MCKNREIQFERTLLDSRCEKYFCMNIVVNPSSRENTIHISDYGTIKIKVTSPAESNKANSAAIELLS
ncbi:MAG TPA: hypothetical protein DGN60_03935 [Chloroflexi bacterium]|nr:hypothetical protein [Chloroflexota bacterium]